MQKENVNIVRNVLVCVGGNKLQLSDIYFDTKIQRVQPRIENFFDWDDLKERQKRDLLLQEFTDSNEGNNFLLAIPGAVDPHVHFNTPGFEFRDDFQHGSLAAAYGGVTTIIDMPCTSLPPVTSSANLYTKIEAIKNKSHIDYALWGGVAGNNFHEKAAEKNVKELANEGVVGFKAYLISGMDSFQDLSFEQMRLVAKFVGKTGKPLAVHAEDKDLISYRMKRFESMNVNSWHSYCQSRDEQAETEAINKLISIAEKVNCRIHVVHLSSKLGLRKIREAKKRGLTLTTETCPHYLYFTQEDFKNDAIRNYLKTAPPVKFEEDKDALWEGLVDGTILFVTTDHAGCDPVKEKSSKNFSEVYSGIPEVEHRVSFLFSEGFLKGKLSLNKQ